MRKLIITAALAVSAAMLSACTAGDAARENINGIIEQVKGLSATEEPHETAASVEPVEQSNTFNIGITGIDTWNPLKTKNELIKEAMQLVYDPLFEINENHIAVPVLATDYSVSPDGKTVDVNLKEGVLWQDGGKFDAYDVAYTVNAILSGATEYGGQLSDVVSCKVVNALTVRFYLGRSVPDFVSLLTFPVVRYQTDMNAGVSAKPVGTGPYSFYGKISTDKYMLTAYDSYHNGRAGIDAVYMISAPSREKYVLMLEANEIDTATDQSIDLGEGMPKGNLSMTSYISDKMTYLGFNMSSSVLENAATRRGIGHLIDKSGIVSSITYSQAEAVDVAINPSSYLYYDTEKNFGSKYEEAYTEFESGGWGRQEKGFTRSVGGAEQRLSVRLLVNSDDSVKLSTARSIKNTLEKYGVVVELDEQPYDMYAAKIAAKDFDAFIGEVQLNANNDLTPLTGAGNDFGYSNPDVDTIIAQSGMTADTAERQQLFISLGEKVRSDAPFEPLYFAKGSLISSSKIKSGIVPTASSYYRAVNVWSVK